MESKKINQLATSVNPSPSDLAIIGDPVTGVSKKITWLQVSTLIGTAANLQQVTDNGATTTNPVTIGGLTITGLSTGVLKSDSGVISSVPFGAANGVATLAGDGKVPSSQLPSYVDDVVEVANYAALPVTGETGKIYITLDNNKVYRWGGSVYVEVAANQAVWGSITGTLANQTDLQNALNLKATDSLVVHLAGTETITGTKTFSNPSKNDGGILLKNGASYSLSGYMNLGGMTDGLRFTSGGGISNFFTLPSSVGYTYTFPEISGTIVAISGGNSTQYIDGTGALQTFPTLISSDNLVKLVRNQSGATMAAGTIVYISGATGNKPLITKALATGDSTSAQTYGLVQASIANNADGYVVVIGNVNNLDTSALTEGQQLYLSGTTAGAYTTTKPYAPTHLVYIGIVLRSHPNQGIIGVKIQNGYELDELHDVSAQSPSNNDGIFFNSSTSLWEKKSIATALGFTPISLSSLSAVSPLIYNNGTGAFSIQVATASQNGYLSSTDFSTFNNKQAALGGTGFVKITGSTISYDNSTYYLASNPSAFITLASLSAGAGISYSNITGVISSTITQYTDALARAAISSSATGLTYTSSTGVFSLTAGYAIPTTAKQTEWDTAYTNRITSLTTTGTSGAATLVANTLNIPNYGSALSGYVPYTGATGNVNLGAYKLTTSSPLIDNIGSGGSLNFKMYDSSDDYALNNNNSFSFYPLAGYYAIFSFNNAGVRKRFLFHTGNLAADTPRYYGMPNADGTLALTSDIVTYTLPTASTTILGGVKVDGTTITINGSGVISGANTYSLPIATASVLGGVKIGSGVSVDVNGVISVSTSYQAPLNGTGFVKATGTTISYDNSTYLTTASAASTYVPYTGATTNVNLGVYSITTGSTATFNSSNSIAAVFTNSGNASNFNSIELKGGSAGTARNWQISKDNSTANAFELAASTTNGGSTYGSPVFKILNTGVATFSGSISASNLSGTNTGDQDLSGYVTIGTTQTITGAKTFSSELVVNGNIVYINGAQPETRYTENDVGALPLGLWRSVLGGDAFYIQKNTAGAGNFSTTIDCLKFASSGAATFASSVSAASFSTGGNIALTTTGAGYYVYGSLPAIRYSYFGYSSGYNGILVGSTTAQSLFFNVDITGNPSGAFSGNGSEYVWRNAGSFITPNASNNGYNTLFSWNSSGQVTINNLSVSGFSIGSNLQLGDYTGSTSLTMAASPNGINKINFYDSNNTEGLYLRTDGESYGGTMTFGARWDDDEAKIVFKMYQVSAGGSYHARVGIGTTAPLKILHIAEGGNNNGILWTDDAAGNYRNEINNTYSGATAASNTMVFKVCNSTTTGQTTALTLNGAGAATFASSISASGNISTTGSFTSTTSGTAEIRLQGSSYGSSYNTSLRSTTGAIGVLQFGNNSDNYMLIGNSGTGGFLDIRTNCSTESIASGTLAIRINVSGSTNFYNTIYSSSDIIAYYSSDKRLKDNIKNIENGIDKIKKLNGVSFNWNNKQDIYEIGKKDYGVIAQDVEDILPELVETRSNGYKAVKYEKLISLLIEGIKEQQVQIDELKKQIA